MLETIKGDLIELALEGKFDVVGHGCNCFSRMKRGIAPQMAKAFGCDTFRLEKQTLNKIDKMGRIDYQALRLYNLKLPPFLVNAIASPIMEKTEKILYVVNMYTQYEWGEPSPGSETPLSMDALRLCLVKMNHVFKGKHIGLPKIGSHLGGGDWAKIEPMIEETLKDCKVTIVEYDKTPTI